MTLNNPISTVAKFEVKTLLRSWFFRIFSGIVIAIIIFFNIMAATEVGQAGWSGRMLAGGLPYMNLYILNIVQSIIAVFLSSDFLSRDKKLDTTEVIYVRDMSNFQYVIGKTLGILYVFGGLNLLVLLFTFIMNFISPDAGFNLFTYLIYPFIISLPTLIFILGISFLVMQFVRNQAITFILILGYIAFELFYLQGDQYGIWDFLGFYTPMAYSSYVGLGNLSQLLFIRGGYLLLGISLTLFTIYKLPRLSQTRIGKRLILIPASVLLIISVGSFLLFVLSEVNNENKIAEQKEIEKGLPIVAGYKIVHYDIELEHNGNIIKGTHKFTVSKNSTNETWPKHLQFYFNTGLNISNITIDGSVVDFSRNLSIISIYSNNLKKDTAIIQLNYTGTPNDDLSYFNIDKEKRQALQRLDPLLAAKKSVFISDHYLLLTKESFWYPIVAERNAFRINNFFTSEIRVKGNGDLNYLTQGNQYNSNDWSVFEGDAQYAKLSIVGGDFISKTLDVDSVKFGIQIKQENTFYEKYFENISDTLPSLIKTLKNDYERNLGLKYPYKRLTFVEVPVHFKSYFRGWSLSNENTQPEMVFIPEAGAGIYQFNLANSIKREKDRAKRDNRELLPKEMETNLFVNLVGNTFSQPSGRGGFFGFRNDVGRSLSSWSPYSLFPLFYNYSFAIEETDLPFLNMSLESYMVSRINSSFNRFGDLSGNDKSILFLKKNKKKLVDLVDEENLLVSIGDIMLSIGNRQFALAQQKIGVDNFSSFIDSLLKVNIGKVIPELKINKVVEVESDAHKNQIPGDIKLPAFLFGDTNVYEFTNDNKKSYYISIEVANHGEADGLIKASVFGGGRGNRGGGGPAGGPGGPPPGGGGMNASFEDLYFIPKGENAKIGIIINNAPRMMTLHTFLSQNVPSDMRISLADFTEAPAGLQTFNGVKVIDKEIKLLRKGEFIVDNEDEGFSVLNTKGRKTLRDYIQEWNENNVDESEFEYKTMYPWNPAEKWTPVLNSSYFGKYTKSYVYKESGDGNAKAKFVAQLPESGRYNVYAMIPSKRMGSFGRPGRDNSQKGSQTYTVYHDDGTNDVEVDIDSDSEEWAFLGEFYFSDGEAVVELSDKSERRVVIADAIKWVKL